MHVFSLPPELIPSLVPRTLRTQHQLLPKDPVPQPEIPSHTSLSCAVCLGTTFVDVDQQRAHVHSDWHRYNVKTRLAGAKPVDEMSFLQLLNALDDSLSGSASSSDSDDDNDEDGNKSDAVTALVSRLKPTMSNNDDDDDESRPTAPPVTSQTWFHSPPSTQIGVYRALFSKDSDPKDYLDELKAMQRRTGGEGEGRTWAMFMVAGGHFAGAIVRVSRPEVEEEEEREGKNKKKLKQPKPDTEVLKHKTFHRYTTRRKQGGSQSVNDNSKGAAISAGAMLRRYGEQALRDEIRNLLTDWADDINDCERIWIRASVSNRRIFLDYDGAIIQKGDERLRTFPFPTRRPTQSEVQRCLLELTRVKITRFTEDELLAQDEAYLASLPQPKPLPVAQTEPEKPKLKPPKLTKEEESFREKWSRLLDMIVKGRLEALKSFWEREGEGLGGVNATIPEWTRDRRASLLQVAAQSGHEDVTQWLLEELRADPTVPMPHSRLDGVVDGDVDEDGDGDDEKEGNGSSGGARRTAYDLARTKGVRDVFRRCAGSHPEWWDWFGAGRVPSALSKEMEDERDEKKKVRRKGLKERVKEREAKEKERAKEKPPSVRVEEEMPKPRVEENPFARKLGGMSGAQDGVAGLTAEMRARVERERRARAAEARLAMRR